MDSGGPGGERTRGRLVLSEGLVLTPDGPQTLDVAIDGERVVEVGPSLDGQARVDCRGCWVGPGLVDLHSHLRQPGQEHKEDIASGAAAGAAGGYTALLAMPNTIPALDTADRVEWVRRRAVETDILEVGVAGAVTMGREGETLADLAGMLAAGTRWFTDDGDSVATSDLVAEALTVLAAGGGILSEHAEDPAQTIGAVMHEGEVSEMLGVGGMPERAETDVIGRDLEVLRHTGGRLHIQHLSTAAAVEQVAAAKGEGLSVTAEVTPHHLTFDHTELKARDPRFKMKPPLRTAADVQAVRAALIDGTIDIVATDHAPHTPAETEEAGLAGGAFGVIGLETAAAAVVTATGLGIEPFFERLAVTPARLGGFADQGRPVAPGATANLVVVDPTATWTPRTFRSRSRNSPFIGRPLRGRIKATFYRGRRTYGND